MTSKAAILAAAVSSLLVVSATAFAADEANSEKCYGVAKAGKNDCAGATSNRKSRFVRELVHSAGHCAVVGTGIALH